MKSHVFGFALLAAAAVVTSAPAQAQNGSLTRSFVSSTGVDSNACTITAPCATFGQAYTKIGANGIIAALDPGKYGPLTNITTGVTINGNGWAAITAPAQSNGITINAGSGNVTLIGLEIDGAGAAYNGIVLNSAGSLTVTNCTLQNFVQNGSSPTPVAVTGNGILMQPTSSPLTFAITNTTASNNGNAGVLYFPPSGSSPGTSGAVDHVIAQANKHGLVFYTGSATGGGTLVTISNSIASDNVTGYGVFVDDGAGPSFVKASIDNVNANGNFFGVGVGDTATVLLNRSVVSGNFTGIQNSTSSSSFYSFQNNVVYMNGVDGYNTLNTMQVLH